MPKRFSKSERERFLDGRHVCILATIGPGGEPVLTPIWYLYRDGRILIRTGVQSIKALNVARDPRVTICVQDERPPYASITIHGRATIEKAPDGLGEVISRRYLGAVGGAAYMRLAREAVEQSEEITLVVTPGRVLSQDFAPETPLVGKLWLLAKRVLPPWL